MFNDSPQLYNLKDKKKVWREGSFSAAVYYYFSYDLGHKWMFVNSKCKYYCQSPRQW